MKPRPLILLNKNDSALSETFIKNHIDYFETPVVNVYSILPRYVDAGNDLLIKIVNRRIRLKAKKKFIELVEKNKINCVLAEYGIVGAEITHVCKEHNIPLIVHFHGHDAHRKSVLQAYKEKYLDMFNYASALIVVSSVMQKSLEDLGAKPEKIFFNGYGVSIESFEFKKRNRNARNVFAIGRFVDKKAPYLLILAFQKVLETNPNYKLRIAGAGYLLETCTRMVKALKLENSIQLLGAISHEYIAKEMAEAFCYVQHSVTAFDGDSEGLPNTILEAAASGIPIVATPHAGISDVLIHKSSALLCEENNIDQLSEYLNLVIARPEYANNLAKNARTYVDNNHDLNDTLLKLEAIISRVL